MSEKIILTTPLKVNGVDLTELEYDISLITINDLAEIERERSQTLGRNGAIVFRVAQNDYLMHVLIGMHAIMKCNPTIDINDLKRLQGYNLAQIANIGMSFFSKPVTQPQESLEEPQEDTQNNSTAQ